MLVVPKMSLEGLSKLFLCKMASATLISLSLLLSLIVSSLFVWDLRFSDGTTTFPFLTGLLPQWIHSFPEFRYDTGTSPSYFPAVDHDPEHLLYHLGGNGPWIPKKRDIIGHALIPPDGCKVEQVHMLSRHAERYPTESAGARHLALLDRLRSWTKPQGSPFDFLQNWTYFTPPANPAFELLTSTSQYAGTLEAFTTGVRLRTRYEHLIPQQGTPIRFWSASSSRDVATARYFADGFFGHGWEEQKQADLQIISESPDRGADTLTPSDTCFNYRSDEDDGRNKGYRALGEWQDHFTAPIKRRLERGENSFRFTSVEIFSMMEMCGFEMLVRDETSPWCDLFTGDEWLDLEYARDLLHFYRAGPGNRYSKSMGWLWLNATLDLLHRGTEAGTLFFSFVHDGDIIPMLSALGFPSGYDENADMQMPRDRNIRGRGYKTSDITPMGGRVVIERLTCQASDGNDVFIRVNINDGIIPIGTRAVGPGNSTSLADFKEFLKSRKKLVGDFREVCGLDQDAADRITFLHQ